jgi:hypothetical protein
MVPYRRHHREEGVLDVRRGGEGRKVDLLGNKLLGIKQALGWEEGNHGTYTQHTHPRTPPRGVHVYVCDGGGGEHRNIQGCRPHRAHEVGVSNPRPWIEREVRVIATEPCNVHQHVPRRR